MKHYKPSSELQRAAEERLRNQRRQAAWWWKYQRRKIQQKHELKSTARRHQIIGTDLPDPPEAA